MDEEPALLTRKEVAKFLRISERTVDRLRKRKEIRALKIGGRVLYLRGEVIAYISSLEKDSE